jgi:hypothetical protein
VQESTNSASPPQTPVRPVTSLDSVIVLCKSIPDPEIEEGGQGVSIPDVALCASPVCSIREPPHDFTKAELEEPEVADLICSALLRMSASTVKFSLKFPFENADDRNFTIVERDTIGWGALALGNLQPQMGKFPRSDVQRLWLLGRVGKGRDGIAHLACTQVRVWNPPYYVIFLFSFYYL